MILLGQLKSTTSGKFYISISSKNVSLDNHWSFCVIGIERWIKAAFHSKGEWRLYLSLKEARHVKSMGQEQLNIIATSQSIRQLSTCRWVWA